MAADSSKYLYSLAEAATALECTEPQVLEYAAFADQQRALTLSVFVADECRDMGGQHAGKFSALCPLTDMEVREVIANGEISVSVYDLLSRVFMYERQGKQIYMDDEILVREESSPSSWSYRNRPKSETISITKDRIKVGRESLEAFQQARNGTPGQGIQSFEQKSCSHSRYLADQNALIEAFGCSEALFENVRKIPWAEEARKVMGRGGRNSIASKFDPLLFAVNLPGSRYGNGITEKEAWSKFERHFPDRYTDVEAYDPRRK